MGADGFTVDVRRDGSGTEVGSGVNVSVMLLDGVVNEQFEGPSDVFPMVKTTLAETDVSIDEASADVHDTDRPAAAWFTPGVFIERPRVTLGSYVAGAEGSANISFTISNPLPIDGHVVIKFPLNFTSINFTAVTVAGVDGGFNASVGGDGYTVDVHRDGTGTEVEAGTNITVTVVDGVTNQLFEGSSDVFPVVKTTLKDSSVSIDEASSGVNSNDRAAAVTFTPGAFAVPPTVALGSSVAGVEGTANLSFTTANPLPADGHVVIKFPSNFTAINSSEARATGIDGSFIVSVGADGYTVYIQRDGSGSEVGSGERVYVEIAGGIKNQQFAGPSDLFPMVKTTLSDVGISIDVASSDYNSGDRPSGVWFSPGRFAEDPIVTLHSYVAGVVGMANISFAVSNPLPADGHIFIEFPSNFTSINCSSAVADEIDGEISVSIGVDGYTVEIHRDGTGTVVEAGADIRVRLLDGVTNQKFEGSSAHFPLVKTALHNTSVTIDDSRQGPKLPAINFTAATLPLVEAGLQYDVAGIETPVNFSFTLVNPLPSVGVVYVEIPLDFSLAAPSSAESDALGALIVNGSFALTVGRDGTGDEIPSGTAITLKLSTVVNRETAGATGNFSITTFTDQAMTNRLVFGWVRVDLYHSMRVAVVARRVVNYLGIISIAHAAIAFRLQLDITGFVQRHFDLP